MIIPKDMPLYKVVKAVLADDGILTLSRQRILWIEAKGEWRWRLDELNYEIVLISGNVKHTLDLTDPTVWEKVKTILSGCSTTA